MSIVALNWAFDVHMTPGPKLVLLALADVADDRGESYPSVRWLAERACISERTAQRYLRELEAGGLITIVQRVRSDGSAASNSYVITFAGGDKLTPPHGDLARDPRDGDGLAVDDRRKSRFQAVSRVTREVVEPESDAAPSPGDNLTGEGVNLSPQGDTAVTGGVTLLSPLYEPPIEPIPPLDPSGLSPQEANRSAIAPVSDEKKPVRGCRLPSDWTLTPDLIDWALSAGLSRAEIDREVETFRDYWAAASGQRAIKLDWNAAFRIWVRKAIEHRGGPHRSVGAGRTPRGDQPGGRSRLMNVIDQLREVPHVE